MVKTFAFTLKSDNILNMLVTDTLIDSSNRDMSKIIDNNKKWNGLWDTGASLSSIDQRVVDELGLTPVGKQKISTANGIILVNTYMIDIALPNHVIVQNVLVSCSNLGEDTDILIGMDIIRHGDFSITHTDNSTTFSFRIPSVKEIDYVQESDNIQSNDG